MIDQYGALQIQQWFEVQHTPEMKKMLPMVRKIIKRWLSDNNNSVPPLSHSMITTIAWQCQRSYIHATIIEPTLRNRHSRYKNRLRRSCQPEPASTPDEILQDKNLSAQQFPQYSLKVPHTYGDRHTSIFMTYLREAYNGRIPENHTLSKSKYWSQLDERIVRLCWAKTLKTKPLREDQIASTWRTVKNSIDSGWRRKYNSNKKKRSSVNSSGYRAPTSRKHQLHRR